MSAHRINPKASVGFGHKNDFYNANRPSYPAAALNQIHQAISKSPPQDLTVLELGSGTGIFSRLILDPPSGYPEFPIKSFTALEPSSGMRDSFERNIPESTKAPVTCLDGTFSHFPEDVKDGSVDVCLIAQAFHWAHPGYGEAASTIARALHPTTGTLIFIWNSESLSVPWVKSFRDVYEVYDGDSPQQRFKYWHALFDTPEYKASFAPPEFSTVHWKGECTKKVAIDRALSKSYTNVLDEDETKGLVQRLEAVLEQGEEMVWVDQKKGIFEYPYDTDVVIMKRK